MQINYDRQQEIYTRRKEEFLHNSSIPSDSDAKSRIPTVGQWRQERIMAPLRPLLEEGQQWLTIGDGNLASEAQWLHQQGVAAHATDLAADLLEVACSQELITSWSKENAEKLSFEDESFDYVLIKEAFHHFPRPWLALYEAFRVCRMGVILLEPNGEHPRPLSSMLRFLRRQPSTIHYRFEKVGNFVYAPNPIELEKFLLGLGGQQILFRFYNDYWMSSEADESPVVGGTSRQKKLRKTVKAVIWLRSLMACMGLVPFGKLGCVLLKQQTTKQVISTMNRCGWYHNCLPVNPFALNDGKATFRKC